MVGGSVVVRVAEFVDEAVGRQVTQEGCWGGSVSIILVALVVAWVQFCSDGCLMLWERRFSEAEVFLSCSSDVRNCESHSIRSRTILNGLIRLCFQEKTIVHKI